MGGRVFKNTDDSLIAERIDLSTQKRIKEELEIFFSESAMLKDFNGYAYDTIPHSYPIELVKDSFGDIDVIVDSAYGADFYKTQIRNYFKDVQYLKQNGNMIHFLFENKYQIDMILVKQESHEAYINYMSYGALGMLSGIIARHIGIIFGLDGWRFRHTDVHILENDSVDIFLDFFKYDSEKWNNLVENPTKENMFALVWSSEFVNKDIFVNGKGAYSHRKREADSPIFAEFFKWIETSAPKKKSVRLFPQSELERNWYLEEIFDKKRKILWNFNVSLKEHYYQEYMQEKMFSLKQKHFNFDIFQDYIFNTLGVVKYGVDELEFKKLYGRFMKSHNVFKMKKEDIFKAIEIFTRE